MLDIPHKFKTDLIGNLKATPIISIAENKGNSYDNNIVHMSNDSINIYHKFRNNNYLEDEKIDVIPCVERVSNVRISNDYDSKKLKINRLRFTLYNYYDVASKLTEKIDVSLMGKKVRLHYATVSTKYLPIYDENDLHINFGETDINHNSSSDRAALIFSGTISRLDYNKDKVTITVEDRTQIKLANKEVPYVGLDILELEKYNNIPKKYIEDKATVPMTFGKVDRAYTLPYFDSENSRVLNFLLDRHKTSGYYKTSKIPKYLEQSLRGEYFLYIKDSSDWLIVENPSYIITWNNQFNPYVSMLSVRGDANNYLVPEISEINVNSDFNVWDVVCVAQRMVDSVYMQDGSLLDIFIAQSHNLQNEVFKNMKSIINNNNKIKTWYREGENTSGYINFDTGIKTYSNDLDDVSQGRWMLLKLDTGPSYSLVNQFVDGDYKGAMFYNADWEVRETDEYTNWLEESDLITNGDGGDLGFHLSALGFESLKEYTNIRNHLGYSEGSYEANLLLYYMLKHIETEEDLDNLFQQGLGYVGVNPQFNINRRSGDSWEVAEGNKSYWGTGAGVNNQLIETSFTNIDSNTIGGWKWAGTGSLGINQGNRTDFGSADENEFMVLFDAKLNSANQYTKPIQYGLKLNNIAFTQYVKVPNIIEKNIHASIIGRKNYYFTEQLEYGILDDFTAIPDYPLINYTHGTDNELPDFIGMSRVWEDMWKDIFYELIWPNEWKWYSSDYLGDNGMWFYQNERNTRIQQMFENEIFDSRLSDFYEVYIGNDTAPFTISYSFFKSFIVRFYTQLMRAMYNFGWMSRYSAYSSEFEFVTSQGGNFVTYGLVGWKDMEIFRNLWSLFGIKGLSGNVGVKFGINIFIELMRYIYQTDIDNEDIYAGNDQHAEWDITFNNATQWNYDVNSYPFRFYMPNLYHMTNPYQGGWIGWYLSTYSNVYDCTETINNSRMYAWDSFGSDLTSDEYFENMYVFMDDFCGAIIKAFAVDVSPAGYLVSFSNTSQESYIVVNAVAQAIADDYDSFVAENPWASGLSYLEGNLNDIEAEYQIVENLVHSQFGSEEVLPDFISTDGVIQKPSDIVMNILVNEMEYGVYDEENNPKKIGEASLLPNYDKFDMNSIVDSRNVHANWKMGFSLNKKKNGKKLIEDILSESRSYPRFTHDAKFGLITIKDSYTYDDIDKIINIDDIINYNFDQTQIEDVMSVGRFFYRFDYGYNRYPMFVDVDIDDLIPDYKFTAHDYYNMTNVDSKKEIQLNYHTDTYTTTEYAKFKILNSCNVHLVAKLDLSLANIDISIGDVIHIPLIDNKTVFNINYGEVSWINNQAIYPLWIVMETNIGVDKISIKAYQLHYLKTDGMHGFLFPEDESYDVLGCTNIQNTSYVYVDDNNIYNINYNANATIDNNIQIPYFNITQTGILSGNDYDLLLKYVSGETSLTKFQRLLLQQDSSGLQAFFDLPEKNPEEEIGILLLEAMTDILDKNSIL